MQQASVVIREALTQGKKHLSNRLAEAQRISKECKGGKNRTRIRKSHLEGENTEGISFEKLKLRDSNLNLNLYLSLKKMY